MAIAELLLLMEKLVTIGLLIGLFIKSCSIHSSIASHTKMDDSQHRDLKFQVSKLRDDIASLTKDIFILKERHK